MNGNPAVPGIVTNFSIAEVMLSSMAAACLTERKRLLDKSIKSVVPFQMCNVSVPLTPNAHPYYQR